MKTFHHIKETLVPFCSPFKKKVKKSWAGIEVARRGLDQNV